MFKSFVNKAAWDYEQIYDSNPIAASLWNEELEVVSCNEAVVKLVGATDKKEYMDRTFDFFPKCQPNGIPTKKMVAEIAEQTISNGSVRTVFELKHASGELIAGDLWAVKTVIGGKNIIAAYLQDLRLLNEMQKKEADLQLKLRETETTHLLMEASPMFMEVWDEQLNLIDCNKNLMALFGVSDTSVLINNYYSFSPKYQPCGTLSEKKGNVLLEQAFREGRAQAEWLFISKDGETVPVDSVIVRVNLKNSIVVVVYSHDLRQIKAVERREQEASELSMTDALTKLANRRCFNIRIDEELRRSVRNAKSISLLMIDIDHFKDYNDNYGHLQGDLALQEIANIINTKINRASDLAARWGGEEFTVLLPDTDKTGAHTIAASIREAIENHKIEYVDNSKTYYHTITVSIGVNTLIPTSSDSVNRFISGADQALYQAKSQARNQIVVYES